jgi:hypothetical protein
VVGQLGQHIVDKNSYAKIVNAALEDLPRRMPHTGFANAEGLKHKGDFTHFDSPSAREFGRRYAAVMLKLEAELKAGALERK